MLPGPTVQRISNKSQRSMSKPGSERAADNQPKRAASPQLDTQLTLFDALHVLVAAQHVDSAEYVNLLQCSRALREWVLTTAPQATLTLRPPDAGEPLDPWRAQLAAVKRALATRGILPRLPTTVALIVSPSTQTAGCDPVVAALTGVQSLELQPVSPKPRLYYAPLPQPDRANVAAFVQRLLTGLPSLHTLAIRGTCTLPDPALAPHITSLTLTIDTAQSSSHELQSVSRYLSQVTAFEVRAGEKHAPELWSRLFSASSSTLTKFTTDTPLRDGLLSSLVERAPCLTELSVRHIELASDTHATKEWKVHKLTVQDTFVLGSLHRLPVYRAGRVQVHYEMGRLDLTARDVGFEPDTWSRINQWCFVTKDVTIIAALCKSEPDALRNALRQLRDLQAPGAVVRFSMWSWNAKLVRILAAAWPTLTHLTFCTLHTNTPLTDNMLTAALTMTRPLIALSVPRLKFRYDHSDCTWPWPEMAVTKLDVLDLLNLPRQTGAVPLCTMRVLELDFHGVEQEHVEPLKAWLAHVQWDMKRALQGTPDESYYTSNNPTVKLYIGSGSEEGDPDAQAACALAQLSVLKAFGWRKQSPKVQAEVTLSLPLTHDVMQALSSLPAWSGKLIFTDASWPLPPSEYTTLIKHIPTSYERWQLSGNIDMHSELIKCIAGGIRATRVALGLGPLSVVLPGFRLMQCRERELEPDRHLHIVAGRSEGF